MMSGCGDTLAQLNSPEHGPGCVDTSTKDSIFHGEERLSTITTSS